jgi:preprotein translocase subunit SecD
MLSPLKKVIFIFFLATVALYISLPKEVPVKFSLGHINVDTKFVRQDLNFQIADSMQIVKKFDLVLGLDLAGGSHLVFEADTSTLNAEDKKEALASLKEVMERRVNLFGVSEPNVQISSFEGRDRIIVELPGVKDVREAVSLIGQVAQLNFVETGDEENPGLIATDLTGADLKRASVTYDQNVGKPVVLLEFNEEGGRKFAEITEKNIGKSLAIFLDNQPVSAPIVQEKITGGSAQISGDFTTETAKNLAIQLNAGALPVSVKLVEERTVGATLGEESIQRSITAGISDFRWCWCLWFWLTENSD